MVYNLLLEKAKHSEQSLLASAGWLVGVSVCAVTPTILQGGNYALTLVSGQCNSTKWTVLSCSEVLFLVSLINLF